MCAFLFAKEALASLPTFHFVVPKPPISTWQAQSVQLFCSSLRLSASSLIFSAAPASLPLLFPSLPLKLTLCSCYTFLFSVLPSLPYSLTHLARTIHSRLLLFYPATTGPCHSFVLRNDMTDELARQDACFSHHLQSRVASLLFPFISTLLLFAVGGVLSYQNSSTSRST